MSGKYFMKSLPYHDAVLTEAVESWGIFRKEAELYSLLFNKYERDPKKVTKWAPDCFVARSNMLVMEDLTSTGYQTTSFQTTLNEQHMKAVFDRLAQMHASSIHFEINQLGGKSIGAIYNKDVLFETTFTSTSGWFVAGLKVISTYSALLCFKICNCLVLPFREFKRSLQREIVTQMIHEKNQSLKVSCGAV